MKGGDIIRVIGMVICLQRVQRQRMYIKEDFLNYDTLLKLLQKPHLRVVISITTYLHF
jgi:hypothetical protein